MTAARCPRVRLRRLRIERLRIVAWLAAGLVGSAIAGTGCASRPSWQEERVVAVPELESDSAADARTGDSTGRADEPRRAASAASDGDASRTEDETSRAASDRAEPDWAEPDWAEPPTAPVRDGDPIARVGDRTLIRADLGDVFLYFFRDAYYEAIGYLVERELVRAEAARLDVRLTKEEIDEAVGEELDLQARELGAEFGGEVTLERFVRDNFKENLDQYRQRVRDVVEMKLLRDRVVRYSLGRDGWADLRRIVVDDRALAEELREKVEEGADFDALAARHSLALSRGQGGRLEGIRPGFLPGGVDSIVLGLPEGEISPILEVEEREGTLYHLYRMVRRVPGERVPYWAVRERIAADLRQSPVTQLELLQWNRVQERRYPVELVVD